VAIVRRRCWQDAVYYGYRLRGQCNRRSGAEYMRRFGRHFLQAESEVAAINMVTAQPPRDSRHDRLLRPGISLMQEGISYLAGSNFLRDCDVVPAAGLGKHRPGAERLFRIVKRRPRQYKNLVVAPASVQEMADLTGSL